MSQETPRSIHHEIEINGSIEAVWDAWTTEDGIKTFFAPDCNIDGRIDGLYEILFFPKEKPGFRGAEGMRIMALEPHTMFSFTWNQTPGLSIREQRTLVNIKFQKLGNQKTKLTFVQSGWGSGEEWDQAFDYFTKAWGDVVLYRLQHRFEHGPVDWSNPPRRPG